MNCESNYPDWCVGAVKGEYIDGCIRGALGGVIREDVMSEIEALERDREQIEERIARLEELLRVAPIDVACVGIGENGHLAFNDPPADIDCERAYKVVPLDDKCRDQQVGEGWFASRDEVPTHAFSMSMKQILRSKSIVCTCPDTRKAEAVKGALEGPVTNMLPSSFLQLHPDCGMFLDKPSAALLTK